MKQDAANHTGRNRVERRNRYGPAIGHRHGHLTRCAVQRHGITITGQAGILHEWLAVAHGRKHVRIRHLKRVLVEDKRVAVGIHGRSRRRCANVGAGVSVVQAVTLLMHCDGGRGEEARTSWWRAEMACKAQACDEIVVVMALTMVMMTVVTRGS